MEKQSIQADNERKPPKIPYTEQTFRHLCFF